MTPETYSAIAKHIGAEILERKTCTISGRKFPLLSYEKEIQTKISPTLGEQKILIPSPDIDPRERQRKRQIFRNDRNLYRRTCDLSGKPIISVYSQDKPHKVYSHASRRSDQWDWKDYGQQIDFSRPFFDQFDDLLKKTPHIGSIVMNSENCEYVIYCDRSKNGYFSMRVADSEDIYYTYLSIRGENLFDCLYVFDCKNCYECINCTKCSTCFYAQNCTDSSFLTSCFDCIGCTYCLGCSGLRNKSYCIANKQLSKEAYMKYLTNIGTDQITKSTELLASTMQNTPRRAYIGDNNDRSCGDNIYQTKQSYMYEGNNTEQGIYAMGCSDGNFLLDIDYHHGGAYMCHVMSAIHSDLCAFCVGVYHSNNIYYSYNINTSDHCFGCANIKQGKYAILNTVYTKHEYETNTQKLINHMKETGERGKFFPAHLSPFCYNESAAQHFFPLSRQEIEQKYSSGRKDPEDITPPSSRYTAGSIQTYTDPNKQKELLKGILKCTQSRRPYRIIPQELAFYIKHQLPIPKTHPSIRIQQRFEKKNDITLHLRTCDKTQKQILSVYPKNAPFKVYNEESYKQEVYG